MTANFTPLQNIHGKVLSLFRMSEAENKMNEGFVAWAQYLGNE